MNQSPLCTKPIILRIAIPSPKRCLFDYLLPAELSTHPYTIGSRVSVIFGRQQLIGVIMEITDHSELELEKLKPITAILDPEPLFDPSLIKLLAWASSYYHYPLGLLFDSVIPTWLQRNPLEKLKLETKVAPSPTTNPAHDLNAAQQAAVDAVSANLDHFKAYLLDGVTGSGKTEVYMQLVTKVIANGKQALILVPEINLTPQTLQRFTERFAVPIAVLHSQISEKQRALAWVQAKLGIAPIVIGTRLSAFAPLKNPGIFIIDEEHDLSFKQQDHFRYSARDLLLKRAQLENCPIVLGTATPALETWHNVKQGRLEYLQLPERAGAAQKPQIELIDIRHNKLEFGLTNSLIAEIKAELEKNNQVLLFLNRRGYAPVLMCLKCGWHQSCKRCACNMIYHQSTHDLRCHHCGASSRVPNDCPQCAAPDITTVGVGTQRLEENLQHHFPEAKIVRVDRDTVQTKKQLQTVLDSIHDRSTNILIGTQMLAKGHHFTNLSLVAIIDIDSALFSADFRATERIGQLITQVAGRTGRGTTPGKVILQTTQPDNPLLQTIIYQGYHEFLAKLYAERCETQLPPYSYQILVRAESKIPAIANDFLRNVRELSQPSNLHVLGPIPAPMEKRQGFYRAQLLFQANKRSILQEFLLKNMHSIEELKLARKVRWSVDVDPLDMY